MCGFEQVLRRYLSLQAGAGSRGVKSFLEDYSLGDKVVFRQEIRIEKVGLIRAGEGIFWFPQGSGLCDKDFEEWV